MEKILATSQTPKTPFAPEWSWVMGEDYIKDIDFKKIAEIILSKEKKIIKDNPPNSLYFSDGGTGLGEDSLTSRYRSFNVFTWQDEEIEKLKIQIFNLYLDFLKMCNVPRQKAWIQCWANVLRNGDQIKPHVHNIGEYCYLGGHVCVQCTDSSTVYINPMSTYQLPFNSLENLDLKFSKNEVGKFTMFQQNIPHYTTKHIGEEERITIAFDLIVNPHRSGDSHLVLFDNLED